MADGHGTRAIRDYLGKLGRGEDKLHRTSEEVRRELVADEMVRRHASERFPEAKVREQVKKSQDAMAKRRAEEAKRKAEEARDE